jgi:hypothetical protein
MMAHSVISSPTMALASLRVPPPSALRKSTPRATDESTQPV